MNIVIFCILFFLSRFKLNLSQATSVQAAILVLAFMIQILTLLYLFLYNIYMFWCACIYIHTFYFIIKQIRLNVVCVSECGHAD